MQEDPEPIPDPRIEPTLTMLRAARLLGVTPKRASEAAKAGQIPTILVGRRRVVPTAKLLELLGMAIPTP